MIYPRMWLHSTNQKLVMPRYVYFASAGSLQHYGLRGGATNVHMPLPVASTGGESLVVHHLVRLQHSVSPGQ